MMNLPPLYLGIDLGGTDIKAIALDEAGTVVWSHGIAAGAEDGREAVLDRLIAVMQQAGRELAPAPIQGVGFAIPGVLDPRTGMVELMTNFTSDWNGFGLREALERRTGMPVSMLNDVRAATVAEQLWGAGRGYTDFICIAIGTGIGGGLVLNGELYMGTRGAAGEVGHQTIDPDGPRCNCGNRGCVEALASGIAITRMAREAILHGDAELADLAESRRPDPHEVARAAARGSVGAQAIYHRAGTAIGRGLANLVCVLNPQAIVVGGGISQAGELLLNPIRDEIERRTIVFTRERGGVDVLQSPLGGKAGAVGAAAWAMRQSAGVPVPGA